MNNLNEAGLPYCETDKSNVSFLNTHISCKNCQLKAFCSKLEPDTAISQQTDNITEHPRPLHRGEHLFRQGDEFRNLYVVRAGGIKLYITTADGTEQILNFYFPGELLSLDSIKSRRHKTSAVALDTTSVCKLSFDKAMTLCHQHTDMYDILFNLAGEEIAGEHNMMLTLGQKPAAEKFAAFLLGTAARHKKSGHYHRELHLCMSRHDIANYLCLADETISRMFSKFSTAGILKASNKTIEILDFKALQILANTGSDQAPVVALQTAAG